MKCKRLVACDLDGTLISSTERFETCQKLYPNNKKEFWSCFQSERFMHLDKPINKVVEFVKSLINENTVTVIISGRSEKQLNKSVEQLNSIGIKFDEIYLRKEGDYRKDYVYKSEILSQLIQKYNPEEVIVIDDSDDVINYISNNFKNVKVIDAKKIQ